MAVTLAVRVEDGLRLAGCLLAAGRWPEREQATRPNKPHRVAEGARRALAAGRDHPAVRAAEALAGEPGPNGGAALLGAAAGGAWPEALAASLDDFRAAAQPAAYWNSTEADWAAAEGELRAVLARGDLAGFLSSLTGRSQAQLVVYPNLLYPGRDTAVTTGKGGTYWLSQPPPAAWGTSPPWRYDERPDEVLATAAEALARALIEGERPELSDEAGVLGLAAAVLFLREAEGEAAGDQFMLMEQRTRRLPHLPGVVRALSSAKGLADSEALRAGLQAARGEKP
jgi:hypothetical protein